MAGWLQVLPHPFLSLLCFPQTQGRRRSCLLQAAAGVEDRRLVWERQEQDLPVGHSLELSLGGWGWFLGISRHRNCLLYTSDAADEVY